MSDAFDADPVLRVDAPAWFRRALDQPFEKRSVTVDGCSVNYLRWGEPIDVGLVFVHGGGAHAHWWTHIAGTFAPIIPCVALDLSGHGDSGHRSAYSLEQWTDEVVAVAEHAGITAPVIVGHSMGGYVSVATAARHPDVPRAAIIVDSPIIEYDPEVVAANRSETFRKPRIYTDPVDAASRFRTVPEQARYLDFVMDHVARRSLRHTDEGWLWKFDHLVFHALAQPTGPRVSEYLPEIRCRVALLRCEEGLVDAEIGRYMYDQMGRRTPVVELPTAGHHPMLDVPLLVITALRTLLADWAHSAPHEPRSQR